MKNREIELALRRGRLQERIASQRTALAARSAPLLGALETADRTLATGRSGIEYLKRHPAQVGVALAILAVLRPKRVWRWGQRALLAWSVWNKVRERLQGSGLVARRAKA